LDRIEIEMADHGGIEIPPLPHFPNTAGPSMATRYVGVRHPRTKEHSQQTR
jgi:hypothetical protein